MGLATVVGGLIGGQLLKGLFKKKQEPPKAPLQAPPQAQRASVVNDALLTRRGSRANQRSSGPQETSSGKKTQLGG